MRVDETFKIYKRHELSGEDYQALSCYYLPLIYPEAFSLYLYSFSRTVGKEYTVRRTIDCVGLGNEQTLNRALARLEATGLIKTYQSETKGWLLELNTPLSSQSFLDNSLLSRALTLAIGEDAVDELKKSHKAISYKDYTDVTHAFNDVFDIKTDVTRPQSYYKRTPKDHLILNDNAFNYIGFKNSFDEDLVNSHIFDDEVMEKGILETAYLYNLSEDEMRDCVYRAINFDHDISLDLIKNHAGRYYREKGLINKPHESREEPVSEPLEVNPTVEPSDNQQLIKILNGQTPEAFLKSLNNKNAVSVQELKDMAKLKETFPFSQGMINAMYLIVFNQINSIPNYNYMEKVANEWLRQNINSIEEAFNYYNERNANKNNKPKKQAVEPEWMKEKSETTPSGSNDLSESEIERILQKRRGRK